MRTVVCPVIRAFEHDGRLCQVGDVVVVAPIEAAALARAGYITLTLPTYNRMDLTAAPDGVAPLYATVPEPDPVEAVGSPAEEEAIHPRRRRRRRLAAEPVDHS